jgi:hypothetical protein
MSVPNLGDKVKYLGLSIKPDPPFIEDPARIGRTGTVVEAYDADGNTVEFNGQWPVNVEWDNGDDVQTCYEGEIEPA